MRGASGQAVAGMAAAARPSGAAGTTARLTAAQAVTLAGLGIVIIIVSSAVPGLVPAMTPMRPM